MLKSLFLKYLLVIISIILAGFILMALTLSYLITNYSVEEKFSALECGAGSMSDFIENKYSRVSTMPLADILDHFSVEFQMSVNMINSHKENISVFAVDRYGNISAYATGEFNGITEEKLFTEKPGEVKLPREILAKLKAGEDVSDKGTMDGIFRVKTMYSATGLYYTGEYIGSVFVITTDTAMNTILSFAIMTLVVFSLAVMLANIIAIYIITLRITKPLHEISRATTEVSRGNFDVRVEVQGSDELKELSERFNEMVENLKNLEYMKSSFVSNVSHELRTPMTTIGGFVDSFLSGAIKPEEEKKYLTLISSEIKRLSRLISSLLEISRIESGQKQLAPEVFDICEMTRLILISNEQRLEEKNLDVEFDTEEDVMNVFADKDAIYQVLYNICDNAVKFSTPGGKYIIAIRYKNDRTEISVYNEGIGIKKDELPFVFNRFYKTDKSRGIDKKGVGLGLFIVKSIVNLHGEDIRVESEYGQYCRFVFTLKRGK